MSYSALGGQRVIPRSSAAVGSCSSSEKGVKVSPDEEIKVSVVFGNLKTFSYDSS